MLFGTLREKGGGFKLQPMASIIMEVDSRQ